MKLTKKQKEKILNRSFSYEEVIKRLGISEVVQKDKFLKMSGWLGNKNQTIAETIAVKKPAHFVLRMLFRKEILPERLIHELAQHFCCDFINRLKEEAIYVDTRYDQLLELKSQWIHQKISLGVLKHAQREASDLLVHSHRTENKMMIAAAAAVHVTMHENARIAILSLFEIIDGIHTKEHQKRYEYLQDLLLT